MPFPPTARPMTPAAAPPALPPKKKGKKGAKGKAKSAFPPRPLQSPIAAAMQSMAPPPPTPTAAPC